MSIKIEDALQEIKKQFEAGYYQACIDQCRSALKSLSGTHRIRQGDVLLWQARAEEPILGRKTALVTLKKALELSQKEDAKPFEAEALVRFVEFTAGGDNFTERRQMLADADKLAKGTPKSNMISGLCEAARTSIVEALNERPDSLTNIDEAIRIWKECDERYALARAFITRALIQKRMNNYSGAEEHLYQALEIANDNGFIAVMASARSWLGVLEKSRDNGQASDRHFKAAEQLYLKIELPSWAENARASWGPATRDRLKYRWAD